jgi:hypothetical protein
MRPRKKEGGFILVLVLLGITFVAATSLGLVLSAGVARMTAANHDEAMVLLNAAESALELAARELALVDLDDVLAGTAASPLVDGPPGLRTVAPGVVIDLVALTNRLTCGQTAACMAVQVQLTTADRPWGHNNPRWRPFLHQPLAPPPLPVPIHPPYVVVWIGDDARESDGDPTVDGAGVGQQGRYIVRARADAFGAHGGRRGIEAELALRCTPDPAGPVCVPGSRVQSWRVVVGPVH